MPSRPAAEPAVRSPLGGDDGARFMRGRLIHRLLQTLPELPPETRAAAAARFLARPVHALDPAQQAQLAREALAVLDHKDFAPLFGPGGVAEAPVVGRLGDHVIAGQIDRLVVTDTTVFVLDYKTQRPVPASPAGCAARLPPADGRLSPRPDGDLSRSRDTLRSGVDRRPEPDGAARRPAR